MRIVLLTPDLSGHTGWSRYSLDLGKALHAQGHEMHCIVAVTEKADWCTQHRILRQPTTYLNAPLLRWFDAWRVRRLLQRIQPDIVHVIAEPYALLFPLMGKRLWKMYMTIHGTYSVLPFVYGNKTRLLFEQAYSLCDVIISVSAFTKNYVQQRVPALFENANLAQKIIIVPNAIDLNRFPPAKKQPSPVKHILSVAGVKPKKGFSEAIEAVAIFLQKNPIDLHYDIFGSTTVDATFVTTLQKRIEELGLKDNIIFHGSVENHIIEDAYAQADLFLMPSLHKGDHFEGFGLVFLEANAYGVPVIGSTTGGCPEAIQEGISGYACNPDDQSAIVKHLEDILIHETITRDACRAWAEKHNVVLTAHTISALYEKSLATS